MYLVTFIRKVKAKRREKIYRGLENLDLICSSVVMEAQDSYELTVNEKSNMYIRVTGDPGIQSSYEAATTARIQGVTRYSPRDRTLNSFNTMHFLLHFPPSQEKIASSV